MKIFLLDLWHDLKAKRLWPGGRGARWSRSSPCRSCSRSRPKTSAPAPVRPLPQGPSRNGPEGSSPRSSSATTSVERRLVARRFDPSNPFHPPKGAIEEGWRGPGPRPPAPPRTTSRRLDRATPAAVTTGGGGTRRCAQRWRHRRRRHRRRRARPRRPPVTRYVVDVTFKANGHTRHIKGLEKLDMLPSQSSPLLIFLGVTPKGRQRGLPRGLDARGRRRGQVQARARPSAPSSTSAPAPSTIFTNDDGDSYTRADRRDPQGQGRRQRRHRARKAGGAKAHALRGPRPAASSSDLADVVVVASDSHSDSDDRHGKSIGRGQCAASSPPALHADRRGSPAWCRPRRRATRQGPGPDRSPASSRCASASAERSDDHAAATSRRSARKNTVIFRAGDGRTAFAKPRRATTHASSWCACRPRWRAC